MRHLPLTFAAILILTLLVIFPPWGTTLSQPPTEVYVTNIPGVQKIEGEVSVVDIVRQSETHRRLDLIVPSVARNDVTDLIEAGRLVSDKFSRVTVSFHGEARSAIEHEGVVGVVLIPDEIAVREVLDDHEAFHFAIEVNSQLVPKGPTHFQAQQRFDLGFPRYKVYLYNSTDRTVDANVYFYLTQ